jgi:hypothetical protein
VAEETYTGDWELVETTGGVRQYRQRVFGGWLVFCQVDENASMTFLPDPNGEWNPPVKQGRKGGGYY